MTARRTILRWWCVGAVVALGALRAPAAASTQSQILSAVCQAD
jgi:hypothetical protein